MKKFSKQTRWNGFKVAFLRNESKYFEAFQRFFAEQKRNEYPENWKILADPKVYLPRKNRTTWIVDDPEIGRVIFKRVRDYQKWNIDLCMRSLRDTTLPLVERTARVHAAGWTFPMQHFLVAERRELGILRESYLIAEFITGTEARDFESPEQWLQMVLDAHAHGFCWHGDARPNNFMIDERGNWRGIDIFVSNSFKELGRDLERATEDFPGLKLPHLFSLDYMRLQTKIRHFFGKK